MRYIFLLHISSSYVKILGVTNFHTREFPRSGSKAKDGEKKEKRKKEERPKVGNNNGQLRIATPPRVAHAKPPRPKSQFQFAIFSEDCNQWVKS